MKFRVAVTTHNPIHFLRTSMLESTMESIDVAFPESERLLLDNGSTDLSHYYFEKLLSLHPRWKLLHNMASDENRTPGRGRNEIMKYLRGVVGNRCDDVIVFSDDDIVWSMAAADILRAFWGGAPHDLVLLGGLLEDEYAHNTPREAITINGVNVLVRDSTPGCAWSFPYNEWWTHIGPVVDDFGYDTRCCEKILASGLRVAQMDLVQHVGGGGSTHGNAQAMWTRPLDRDRWGV